MRAPYAAFKNETRWLQSASVMPTTVEIKTAIVRGERQAFLCFSGAAALGRVDVRSRWTIDDRSKAARSPTTAPRNLTAFLRLAPDSTPPIVAAVDISSAISNVAELLARRLR